MNVKPTAQNKGLELTLRVTAYDNGMVQVDGVPINDIVNDRDPSAHGWLGAAEVAVLIISEFRRQVEWTSPGRWTPGLCGHARW
jgi:hypothetical protein